ncbi:MAG: hypothetical protein AB1921_03050 [Thermodesulfobacteriota bacterium]
MMIKTQTLGRLAVIFLCVAAVAAVGCSDKKKPPVPLAEVPVDFAALAASGEQIYLIGLVSDPKNPSVKPQYNYIMRSSAELSGDNVIISDRLTLSGRKYQTALTCQKNSLLSLIRSTLTVTEGGTVVQTVSVTITGGFAELVDSTGKTSSIDYPNNTLTQAALFRLVTRLPKEKGGSFSFSYYSDPMNTLVEKSAPDKPFLIECRGPATAKVLDAEVPCTLFVLTGTKREVSLYVDDQSRLRLMETDQGATRMQMITPEQASEYEK